MKEKNQKLKTLVSDAQRQRKRRAEKKKIIAELPNQSTSNASKLKKFTHTSSGRPPLEDTYPDLHQAIVALSTTGADLHQAIVALAKAGAGAETLNRETPKQTELKAEIAKIESKITSLTALKESFKKSPKSIEREKSKAENINIRCSKENHLRVVQSKHLQYLKTKKVHSRGYILFLADLH